MDLGSTPRAAHLSAADMSALARILRSLDVALTGGEPAVPAHSSQSQECVVLARRLKSTRNLRTQIFAEDLFGEPAWDIMLALYIAAGEGYRLKISELCHESGVPSTTALRWIDKLVDVGLARKIPNPLDARSIFIQATDALQSRMTDYLHNVLARHLSARGPTR